MPLWRPGRAGFVVICALSGSGRLLPRHPARRHILMPLMTFFANK